MNRILVLACTCLIAWTAPQSGGESWVGKTVMQKREKVAFGDGTGAKQELFDLKGTDFPVLKELDGKLRIRGQDGREGWVDKADFVAVADAPDYYSDLIRKSTDISWALVMRGIAWHNVAEFDKAIQDYTDALHLNLKDSTVCYLNRGRAWQGKKDFDRAIADYRHVLQLDPKNALAYNNCGVAWESKKEYDRAIADYTEAIRLNPKNAKFYSNRGFAWECKKAYDKAIADYSEAIQLEPTNKDGFNGAAWLLATRPEVYYRDGKKAVALATRACELTQWKDGNLLDTLAAAHAETGDFDRAVQYEQQALQDPALRGDAGNASRERLELYKKKMPYRLPQ